MRKRIVILLLAIFTAGAALVLFRSLFNNEPQYRGKKLSVWFKQYYRTGQWSRRRDEWRHEQAARALHAMGTNAVPYLVTECFATNRESPFQTNVLTFLGDLPGPFRFPPFVPAMSVREEAASAIGEIKPPANLLLPVVTNHLNDPDKYQRWMSVYLLGKIGEGGEAAVPFLTMKLSSLDAQELALTALALDRLGPAAEGAVPHLVEFVRTNSYYSTYYACRALARIGPAASNAIPVLNEKLAVETNSSRQVQLAIALLCIDSQGTDGLRFLDAMLADVQKTNAHRELVWALRDIGPNGRPALPLLVAALTNRAPEVWHPALFGLLNLGETNLAISSAMEKMRQDQTTRFNAMKFLFCVQPTNALAMSNLVAEVNGLMWGGSAIDEAAKLGALAQPVIPRLREIAGSKTNP